MNPNPTAIPEKMLEFADLVERQLVLLGEDPSRDGLLRTPVRVAKAFAESPAVIAKHPKQS